MSVGAAVTLPDRQGCFIVTIRKAEISKNKCFVVLQTSRMD